MANNCVIFDLGNVIARWDYLGILQAIFPGQNHQDLYLGMRCGWIDWNLGKVTEPELKDQYHQELSIPYEQLDRMFDLVKSSHTLLPGSYELLADLRQAGAQLYSITDNTKEIIAYHQKQSNFLHFFIDVVVSADVGVVKPDPALYLTLLQRNKLQADQCVFIDDIEANIKGAQAVGISGILFTSADQARAALIEHGFLLGEDQSL